ncbi:hypothetical protein HPP92_019152 [Vanilla planifolia]|uniref:Uncharacterized protein n=1 Tax=Vanilla planifolia TaxID=51239 RepID=A0A835Q9R6_VANPL|nr:hypothetical protein HPP92_019152 [Vanilla planifolia]
MHPISRWGRRVKKPARAALRVIIDAATTDVGERRETQPPPSATSSTAIPLLLWAHPSPDVADDISSLWHHHLLLLLLRRGGNLLRPQRGPCPGLLVLGLTAFLAPRMQRSVLRIALRHNVADGDTPRRPSSLVISVDHILQRKAEVGVRSAAGGQWRRCGVSEDYAGCVSGCRSAFERHFAASPITVKSASTNSSRDERDFTTAVARDTPHTKNKETNNTSHTQWKIFQL